MAWINEYLNKRVIVTSHARERWEERFGDQDMGPTIAKALPFGAQNGPSLMLKHEDAVLIVKNDQNGLVAITTLTAAQAMQNMHVQGYRPHLIHEPIGGAFRLGGVKPPPDTAEAAWKAVVAKTGPQPNPNSIVGQFLVDTPDPSTLADDRLEEIAVQAKAHTAVASGKVLTNVNRLLGEIDRERARRKRVIKAEAHSQLMSRKNIALTCAMTELLADDVREAIYARVNQIEERVGSKIGDAGWRVLLEIADAEAAAASELTTLPGCAQ